MVAASARVLTGRWIRRKARYLPGPIFSESSPFRGGPPGGGTLAEPLPFNVGAEEAMTGRLQLGVGVNSDAGLVGSLILDEQNFDWTRFPTSWEDIRNGTAFRGAGQRFRIQAMPGIATIAGTQPAQQYSVTFQDPYIFDTQVSLGLSGFYYNRIYTEYTDQRLGGRIAFGYQFTPDFSATVAYRGQSIRISNPIDPTLNVFQGILDRNLALHGFALTLTENKRDSDFMPTEGYFIEGNFEEVLGSFQYPHAELDVRKYFTLFQRPDCSGRQVLSLAARAGFTGDNTPIYERYYAGGFSTLRGFQFRGASPIGTRQRRTNGHDRRRLRVARLDRIQLSHHGRRHAPRRGVLRLGHGRADGEQLDEQVPRGARLRAADLRAGDGPGAHRVGLRLPHLLAARRPSRAVQLLYGHQPVVPAGQSF